LFDNIRSLPGFAFYALSLRFIVLEHPFRLCGQLSVAFFHRQLQESATFIQRNGLINVG